VTDISKEKERKKRWYEANKERIKQQRASKREASTVVEEPTHDEVPTPKRQNRDWPRTFAIACYASTCAACTFLLVKIMAESLGGTFEAITTAILVECGVLAFSLADTGNRSEDIFFKLSAAVLVGITSFVIWTGTGKGIGEVDKVKLDLANELVDSIKNMPSDYHKMRAESLKTLNNTLEGMKSKTDYKSKGEGLVQLVIRLVLLFENLAFARLLKRVISQDR
jgi:thermostable 8-oxoguanine DNA glycosylase